MMTQDRIMGLKEGDDVTTHGGPDAEGPWKAMGKGTVAGPSRQKGFLDVKFENGNGNWETFSIKAKNLTTFSEPNIPSLDSDMERNCIGPGDAVLWQKEARGVVMGAGHSPETVMVKFGGVGVRSVRIDQLTKVMLSYELEQVEQGGRNMSNAEKLRNQESRIICAATYAQVETPHRVEEPLNGLNVGDFVQAKVCPWRSMGIGIVKNVAPQQSKACVQFNIMGESWTLNCDDLELVPDPGSCKFKHEVRNFDHKQTTTWSMKIHKDLLETAHH